MGERKRETEIAREGRPWQNMSRLQLVSKTTEKGEVIGGRRRRDAVRIAPIGSSRIVAASASLARAVVGNLGATFSFFLFLSLSPSLLFFLSFSFSLSLSLS